MRFLRISNTCVNYAGWFYAQRPGLASLPFAQQRAEFDRDHFGWGSAYTNALRPLGYETEEFVTDLGPLQRAWAAEHGLDPRRCAPEQIILEQARWFRPDILQFEMNNGRLLAEIRSQVPNIRLVIGWEGSALSTGKSWPHMDLVLSCAPEAVVKLRRLGLCAEHLNHAFDPDVGNHLRPSRRTVPISFIGSIIRRDQFHVDRDQILNRLAAMVPVEIYSPSVRADWKLYAKAAAAGAAFYAVRILGHAGPELPTKGSGLIAQAYRIASRPRLPINPKLRRHLRPPVFGLEYYQTMHDSHVTLNIHADSSPTHASNVRLFEATGVGSCLLTDHRDNIRQLFEPESEIVTYRSTEDCAEKVRWLLNNAPARLQIAAKGRERTAKDHTFTKRARELDIVIGKALAGTAGGCLSISY